MKKVLLFLACILTLAGCNKEDIPPAVMINVSYQFPEFPERGKTIATPTLVLLYDYSVAASFDKVKSIDSMSEINKIMLPDGSTPEPKYSSAPNLTGVNTFENIEDGRYMVIVFFQPSGFTWNMLYYYGYKEIEVNDANKIQSYNLVFNWGDDYCGRFIAF